jgi:hypothetical protein
VSASAKRFLALVSPNRRLPEPATTGRPSGAARRRGRAQSAPAKLGAAWTTRSPAASWRSLATSSTFRRTWVRPTTGSLALRTRRTWAGRRTCRRTCPPPTATTREELVGHTAKEECLAAHLLVHRELVEAFSGAKPEVQLSDPPGSSITPSSDTTRTGVQVPSGRPGGLGCRGFFVLGEQEESMSSSRRLA